MDQEKPKTEINIKDISADDLKSLKQKDPFLYYSIPGVRSAKLLLKDVDLSNLGAPIMSRSCVPCPSRMQTTSRGKAAQQEQTVVTHTSRITFECYPDVLLEDTFKRPGLR